MAQSMFLNKLVEEKLLTPQDSLELLKKHNGDLFALLQYLLNGKIAKKDYLGKLWGDSLGVSYVDLEKTLFQNQVIQKLPEVFAKKHHIIPLYELDGVATVATAYPLNFEMLDEAKKLMGCPISAIFAFPHEIIDAIDIQYLSGDALSKTIQKIADSALFKGTTQITTEQLKQLAGDQYMVDFSRNLLLLAVKERASDIHIDPQEDLVYIRFRIDGVLHDRLKIESSLLSPLVSRIKIMANIDITEKRKPQDGRIAISLTEKNIDFRLSTVPCIYGEKIVLRILGQVLKNDVPDLEELDFSKSNLKLIKKIIETPNGIFFVTGPTGSGKSTTLFSALKYLNKPEVNIMTAEDPVEYRLPRVTQVQVNAAIGFDFASALRAFLRQDPDIILIGEIRDLETAKIASQAALTGHLVIATMHTNNSFQAVTRLIEIGVEPFLVAPSIIGVMAQRLVRRICPSCKESYKLKPEEIEKYFIWDGETEVSFYRGKGCQACNNIGYSGRVAIHEIFVINNEIRDLISRGASILEIKESADKKGFDTMHYDGMKKVLMGLTTIEELERVTAADE